MWLLENFKLRVWLAFSLLYSAAVYSTTKKEVWKTETLIKVHPSIQFRLWQCYRKTNSVSSTNEWFKGKIKGSKGPSEMESGWEREQRRKKGRKEEIEGKHTCKRLKCIILGIPVCGFYLDPKKTNLETKMEKREGASLVKNVPSNAEDTGLIPGPGRSHRLWGS